SVKESDSPAEMAVRRGGRGRRRGGKPKGKAHGDDQANVDSDEVLDLELIGDDEDSSPAEPHNDVAPEPENILELDPEPAVVVAEEASQDGQEAQQEDRAERGDRNRNRRGRGGRDRDRDNRDRQNGGGNRGDRRDRAPQPAISDLLREGQEILVQIAKE